MNHTTIPRVFYESSERGKRRKKNEIKNQLLFLQKNLLNKYGLQFSRIVITPHATTEQNNQDFSVDISYLNQAQFNSESDLSIKKVIYAKDKHNISDRTYVGLLKDLDLNLPSLYVLKAERKKYDAMLYIFENS
jgi:type III secretory pathway component EscV